MSDVAAYGDWAPADKPAKPFGLAIGAVGVAITLAFAGIFGAWAALVPLESAVVSKGALRVGSSVRTVQHLEGGIVDEIHVRDGDTVRSGDLLMKLRPTIPLSQLNRHEADLLEARAAEARLLAERDGLDKVAFPPELSETPYGRNAIAHQEKIFASRKNVFDEQSEILKRTIQGIEYEIQGFEGRMAARQRQIQLLDTELTGVRELSRKGLVSQPRHLALEREKSQREGDVNRFTAEIGALRQRIEATNLRMVEVKAARVAELSNEIRTTRARIYELTQIISAAKDVTSRLEIRAPIDGVVMRQQVHTLGGVVGAGAPVMDIVPAKDDLVVMASVDPRDVDQIQAGQEAAVWLSATHRRHSTPLRGKVTSVSADQIGDPLNGTGSFYLARIELDPAGVTEASTSLQAGMTVEVLIRSGTRTAWSYISSPIKRYLDRGLREQ